MIISYREMDYEDRFKYSILDLDTGMEVFGPIIWVDDEAGQIGKLQYDDNGNILMMEDQSDVAIEVIEGSFKIFERSPQVLQVLQNHSGELSSIRKGTLNHG